MPLPDVDRSIDGCGLTGVLSSDGTQHSVRSDETSCTQHSVCTVKSVTARGTQFLPWVSRPNGSELTAVVADGQRIVVSKAVGGGFAYVHGDWASAEWVR